MSDDARSTFTKKPRKRRILVISNASPESSEDDMPPPEPPKPLKTYPRPLPSPAHSLPSTAQFPHERYHSGPASSHMPPPLTTNLHCYPRSNPSNPALSSPSSTSSPAVESTPPPSTPGLNGSRIQLSEEGTITQDMISSVGSDRNENTPQARPRPFVRPQPQPNPRRYSSSGSRPATSPTVSTPDSYMPTPPHVFRSNPMGKANVLVTTDAENYHIVDITGAMTSAFIRERIFTKLQISDEDHPKFSIYRTEIGQFAIGDALTDEELFDLYREHGDSSGKLKLLVSHSSASVHEPGYDSIPTSTVNTIPPPVLPQASLYAPLRPNRQTRLRQGSQSSASEPHPAEVGYEASVSDDLDHNDVDTAARDARDYGRSAIHSRALPMPINRPSSPSGYGRRSRSPANLLSPERTVVQSPESRAYRSDPYHIGASPVPGTSPQTSRFEEAHPLPPLPPSDPRSSPATEIPERERSHTNDGTPSSYNDHWQREREEKERRRRELRKDNARQRDQDTESRAWTIVPGDVPSSGYRRDRPTTPQEARSGGRFPLTPPSLIGPLSSYRTGSSGSGESSSRRKLKQVPSNWAVTWKHSSNKADPKPVPTASPPSLMRHGAKSMTDMRGAFKHPPSLQPGRGSRVPPQPPLPMITRPSTGGSSVGAPPLPSASSSGDILSAHSELGPSPDVARPALSPSNSYMRSQYGLQSATPTVGGYLGSPAQDPFPRPHSALGESSSSPYNQPRYMHSPQNSETSDSISHRIPPPPAQGYGTNVSIHSYRDDAPRVPPPQVYGDQQSEAGVGTGTAVHSIRGPRTPPRSPVDGTICGPATNGFEPSSLPTEPPGTAFAKRGAIDEDGGSHTVRADDRTWLKGFIDENAAEGTMRPPPKPRPPPTQQLPTPPPTVDMPAMSTVLSTSSGSTLIDGTNDTHADDEESDSDPGGSLIWAKKPPKKPSEPQQATPVQKPAPASRPPLTPLVFPSMDPNAAASSSNVDYGRSPPPGFPGPPDFLPSSIPPRTPRRTPAITQPTKKLKDRISKFDNNFDVTWAPRPPPEVMYERLEEYFPEHDLDKPVIDAPSGGTSPTATEAPAVPVSRGFKHKKSIRVVANEHKRQMDRTSRGDDSTVAPLSRKRHTKLWGSKLEEVTTEQGKGPLSSTSADASPGGGVKPIFRWVRGELIGKGTYGRVYLALNATTGEMIAVKQVEIPRTASDKDDSRQVSVVEALKLESETLKDLDHPNIVQYLGFEETPTFLSIFLEYVPGGSIASCLRKHGRFDEEVTKSFTGQILGGLEYLHSRGILHRDLKADNILVETSGVCKISDFGISKRTDDINMAAAYTSMQGTVFWMAPEVVNSKGKGYNSKIDIWSVGCVVFEMWTGQRPWNGQEAMAVLLHLYQTKQAPPVPDGIVLSPLADDFRLKCFAADPDERPSAAELRKHTYLELQPGWSFNGFK